MLLICFFFKNIALIFLTPPWEAPDEPGHVAYVKFLYDKHELPSANKPFIPVAINRSIREERIVRKTKTKYFSKRMELFDRNNDNLSPISANLGSHPPLYYIYLLPFYTLSLFFPSYWSLIFLRIATLMLGILCLFIIFRLSKRILKSDVLALIVTLLISLQPTFSFISSIVNSDIMVVLSFLFFLYFGSLFLAQIKDRIYTWVLFAITALSPLIKPQLIVLIPVYFILLVMRLKKKKYMRSTFISMSSAIPTLLWFCYKRLTDGDNFITYAVQNMHTTDATLLQYPLEFISGKQYLGIFMSFWGYFGWLDVPMNKMIYVLYGLVILLGVLGWVLYLKDNKKFRFSNTTIFIGVSSLLYFLFIILYDVQYFLLSHTFSIQGRYLTPLLIPLLIFIVKGIFLLPQLRKWVFFFVISVFVFGSVLAFRTIIHYYYPQGDTLLFLRTYRL